ncbi:unnamed protein product [Linum tenue]|uniref:Uncharacterized protein n=1 Tax=Linum tenue TaxID=586396 RepID=A0AAV0P243_9ROSI|nr:unnamed protein product [Linum tenue]
MEISYLLYFILFLLSYPLAKYFLKPKTGSLPLPPSPAFPLPILGHLHLLRKPLHRTLAALSAKHGGGATLLRFGSRRVLHVSSPSLAEECFTKNDVAFANRPGLLAGKHLGYNFTTLVWAPYGHHWRNLRRVATIEILSTTRIHMLQQIRVDETRATLLRLFEKSTSASGVAVVDMKSMFFELTMNVMMRMIAGKRYYTGGAGGEEELEEAKMFKEIVEETMELSGATNVGDFVPVLRWVGLNKGEKRLAALQGKRDGFMQKLIEERRRRSVTAARGGSGEGGHKTMTDVLLGLQETEPKYYTDDIIRGLMLSHNMI